MKHGSVRRGAVAAVMIGMAAVGCTAEGKDGATVRVEAADELCPGLSGTAVPLETVKDRWNASAPEGQRLTVAIGGEDWGGANGTALTVTTVPESGGCTSALRIALPVDADEQDSWDRFTAAVTGSPVTAVPEAICTEGWTFNVVTKAPESPTFTAQSCA